MLHALEQAIPEPENPLAFTVYEDIRQKLIAQGMPASQIAFIHEANTEVRKKELFSICYRLWANCMNQLVCVSTD